jgi:hypothetical protein
MAQGVAGTTTIKRCIDCGRPISRAAKRCNRCYGLTKRKRPAIKSCLGCGKQLSKWAHKAGSKRCRKCAPGTPEERARRSASSRQIYVDRPELREDRRRDAAALQSRPDLRANQDKARGRWRQGVRRSRLGWCPEEYWPTYERLRRRQMPDPATGRWSINGQKVHGPKLGAAKARAMIERHLGGPLRPVSMTWPQLLRAECKLGDDIVRLRPASATLLSILLVQNPEGYLTNEELIVRMWPDPDLEPDSASRIIDQYLMFLRQSGIRVVRAHGKGRGYRIPAEARAR